MVNYDWHCDNPYCPHPNFERQADPLIKILACPCCGAPARRAPSAPAFSVKGGTPKFHK